MKKIKTLSFALVITLSACGGGGGGSGGGSGSQDNLVPSNIPQNGALGSWFVEHLVTQNGSTADTYMYIEQNKLTAVNRCAFPNGHKLVAVASAPSSLVATNGTNVFDLHALRASSSRVYDGQMWCEAHIQPATLRMQLNSEFEMQIWAEGAMYTMQRVQ